MGDEASASAAVPPFPITQLPSPIGLEHDRRRGHAAPYHIVGDTIWIRAARNIQPGEELTYDYYTNGSNGIRCRCRPNCKRIL